MRPAAIVAAALLTTSCASAGRAYHRAADDLGKSVRLFNDYTRWGYTDKAAEFVDGETRAAFVEWRTNAEKQVKITDVHVGVVDFPKDSTEATATVTWTFYRTDRLTEETRVGTEHWHQQNFHWFVHYEAASIPTR